MPIETLGNDMTILHGTHACLHQGSSLYVLKKHDCGLKCNRNRMDAVDTYFGLCENAMNRHGLEGYPKKSSRSTRPEIGLSKVVLSMRLLY